MPTLTLYLDPISPYVWLAMRQLARIDAAGLDIDIEPVLFAGLLNAHGQKGPAEIPAKRAYTFRDVMRQAALLGLPFRGPPGHPFNPLLALRMCIALSGQAERRQFMLALCTACWEDGTDISAPSELEALADRCGHDGAALREAATSAPIKQQLAANTERAIAAGIFGVPTFAVDGQLFWGADRIDALLAHARGQRIDETMLADFLARAPLAERRIATTTSI